MMKTDPSEKLPPGVEATELAHQAAAHSYITIKTCLNPKIAHKLCSASGRSASGRTPLPGASYMDHNLG